MQAADLNLDIGVYFFNFPNQLLSYHKWNTSVKKARIFTYRNV